MWFILIGVIALFFFGRKLSTAGTTATLPQTQILPHPNPARNFLQRGRSVVSGPSLSDFGNQQGPVFIKPFGTSPIVAQPGSGVSSGSGTGSGSGSGGSGTGGRTLAPSGQPHAFPQ